jgi:flagellar protein FliL
LHGPRAAALCLPPIAVATGAPPATPVSGAGPEGNMRVPSLLLLLLCLCVQAPGARASSEGGSEAAPNTRGYDFVELKPALVVNFGSTGRVAYLKAGVSLKVASAAKAAIEPHLPAIRHELIMLLSRQDEAALGPGEQRDALRLAALEALRALLTESAGIEAEDLQDLLFTEMVTQR